MKYHRQIAHNWNEIQVQILRENNINVQLGIDSFNIYDLKLYKKIKPLLEKWEVNLDYIGVDFTKKERDSAQYSIIDRWNSFGYPMPDSDLSYLYNTYETKNMCKKCGIGAIQKEDFRVLKTPKYPVWGLEWVYDELFIRKDLYRKIFEPLGIGFRHMRNFKNDSIVDSYIQLEIPLINESLDFPSYYPNKCPICGVIKYDPKVQGFYPLHKHPLPYIYKSMEYFGSGFSAYRKIFVSAFIRNLMIKNGIFKIGAFIPCAKSEDLSTLNHDFQEWSNARRTII